MAEEGTSWSLKAIKEMIARGNLEGVKECYAELQAGDEGDVDWPLLFKECYLHACLKGQPRVSEWFQEMFKEFDPIAQIALRQTFAYGRHLQRKAR
jgi:hypothetical protein